MIAIIGGTAGIGLETSKYLLSQGYDVLSCGRNNPNVENIRYQYVDVTSEESIKSMFADIHKLDGLIYSAGTTTKQKEISKFDRLIYEKLMGTNVTGLLLCLKYAYNLLKLTKGKVVVINSLAARSYSQFSGVEYTISKTALSGLVKHLSVDFAKDQVLINSVFPSMTATSMLIDNVDKEILRDIEKNIPLGRIAKPSEMANAIEFLISNKNTYMTGAGLDINGGQFLSG